MDMEIRIENDTVFFNIMGAIDTEGAPELTVKFMELVKDTSLKHAQFDLSEVSFITSAGIGKLLAFFKHFDKLGGSLKISAVSPELAKQFEEIHLNNIIPIG